MGQIEYKPVYRLAVNKLVFYDRALTFRLKIWTKQQGWFTQVFYPYRLFLANKQIGTKVFYVDAQSYI